MQDRYDYASILFHGGCNLACPKCIGRSSEFQGLEENLKVFPLKGLDEFLEIVNRFRIGYISFSGIFGDPQLYCYEAKLIEYVRSRCIHSPVLSLHTNGLLALNKMDVFNRYDKATISFPSYHPDTYSLITGSNEMPEIEKIVQVSKIPIKLSFLLTEHNARELLDYIKRSKDMGIERIVVRKIYGEEDRIAVFEELIPSGLVYNNPTYSIYDTEVTVWNYTTSTIRGIYLFPDGSIKEKFI